MFWNKFCFFALLCFTTPLPDLNTEKEFCTFFQSEDVDKRSMVLDLSKYKKESRKLRDCMEKGPFNTILVHAPEEMSGYLPIRFEIETIKYDHLIVLYEAMLMNFITQWGRGKSVATSLTVYKNSNLIKWSWLKNAEFKYIRIDGCSILKEQQERIDDLILSKSLLTLTLMKIENLLPFDELNYELAPNLRELTINHFGIYWLDGSRSIHSKYLRRLDLSYNRIWKMEKDFFQHMPELKVLILEGNNFKSIHPESFPPLRSLLLDNNPFDGDAVTCEFLLSSSSVDYHMTSQICQN